jgi:simple sugar transport system permease protein
MTRPDPRRVLVGLAAPALAIVIALLVSSVVLAAAGDPVWGTYSLLLDYGQQPRSMSLVLNSATIYYLSGLAVAIGFRMNLFNIGVDGQYRIAAVVAAVVGAAVTLPPVLHVLLIIAVAVAVGAAWAGIAGLLKVRRGVSEVISTIMLNFIAGSIISWMVNENRFGTSVNGIVATDQIAPSGWFPGFQLEGGQVYGFIVVAALVGVLYWFVLGRTRFGFDLRATGLSEPAAVASGVGVKRMVLTSMLLSGGVAGLVGLPLLLGDSHSYGQNFPIGIGFTGIAIALLGRNHPIGMALAALLWSFLDVSNIILDLASIPKEIVVIMQGTIVLAVVVAYEVTRRAGVAAEQRRVAAELAPSAPAAAAAGGTR